MNPGIAYLFIDGGYLRKRYAEAMKRVFGDDGEIDIGAVRNWLCGKFAGSVIPRRVFYYDCLADVKKEKESEEQYQTRVEHQKSEFQKIQSLAGFHVRLGRLTGRTGNLRQKGVDVLLAVEMLDNAFRKNMDEAWLLAGDADFVPLVEAVTRLGTWVNVFYDPRAGSKELYSAGDQGIPFVFADAYAWSTSAAQRRCPYPERLEIGDNHRAGLAQSKTARRGTDEKGTRYLCAQSLNKPWFALTPDTPGISLGFKHDNLDVLKNFANEYFGPISWSS